MSSSSSSSSDLSSQSYSSSSSSSRKPTPEWDPVAAQMAAYNERAPEEWDREEE
jgi:hypothetical protein